jgi:hypothetical protein
LLDFILAVEFFDVDLAFAEAKILRNERRKKENQKGVCQDEFIQTNMG